MSIAKSWPIGVLGLALASVGVHAQETIKIGVIQPLTGSVAYNGTTDVNGSKLALDEINAKGGVLGKKLELVVEDGQCRPANSVNAAEKLIQRDKVVAISGAFCSSSTLPVMPVVANYKLLTKLRSSGADGVFVAAETQDGSIFVKQKAELGLTTKVFGVGSWATPDFIKLTGESSEGIYAAVPYASTMTTPKNKAFVAAYTARYNEAPGKYAAAGYNAVNILADAITRAGSTDPEKLREALAKTNYEGPNGHFEFDSKGLASAFTVRLVQLLQS